MTPIPILINAHQFTMAYRELESSESWMELLPNSAIFDVLRAEGEEPLKGANVMCEIRGDLFVWSQSQPALLTTNLKRLVAFPNMPPSFQTLVCTSAPLTTVLQLLPDPDGLHIALHCKKALSVMKLTRLRGPHGEFGGGQGTVNCKVVLVAEELFSIYRHSLELLQVEWHLDQPGALCLLTSDDTLRVFTLADPNMPLLTIPLSTPTLLHGCTLEDNVIAFSLLSTTAFILWDTGDIHMTTLSPGATCSPPLVMHPPAEDNYGSDASSILALPTSPPALVIANTSGALYHCVYLHEERKQQEEEEERSSSQMLYVFEGVHLDLTSGDSQIILLPDPVVVHRYYVVHSNGVHMVTLPWLASMEAFTSSDLPSLPPNEEACVEYLVAMEPGVLRLQGMVIISEPLLGYSLVGLTSDWECFTLSLTPMSESQQPLADITTSAIHVPHPPADSHRSLFEQEIWDILCSEHVKESFPRLRHYSGRRQGLSQQESFRFLSNCVQQLRMRFLMPQQKAKAKLKHRMDVLCRQKQQQIEDLVRLRDDLEAVEQHMEVLQQRVVNLSAQSYSLVHRMEQLVCRLDAQSPVLSDAEVSMAEELKRLSKHLDRLKQKLEGAQAKLELGLNGDCSPKPTLSAGQSTTVLAALAEGGQNIRGLMHQIKSLSSMAPT